MSYFLCGVTCFHIILQMPSKSCCLEDAFPAYSGNSEAELRHRLSFL